MLAAAVFAGSLVAAIAGTYALKPVLGAPVFERTNYAGRTVPTGAGILFPAVYVLVYVVVLLTEEMGLPVFGFRESLLLLVAGMCLLGLVDDVAGDRSARGFSGHIRELFRGRLTTGMLKAAGGFLLAMAVSFPIASHWWEVLLDAAVIALSANLANLLDLRPGRAIKVFLPVLAGIIALNWRSPRDVLPWLLCVGAVALALFGGDLAERFMLGDAGSNVLGATIGIGIAVGAGDWWKLGALVFLALLNILSEKVSFSRLIDANRALKRLDSLGRKGQTDPGDNNN